MRNSSVALLVALVAAGGLALAYGQRTSASAAVAREDMTQAAIVDDMPGETTALPPNHPPINGNGAMDFPTMPAARNDSEGALIWKAPPAWTSAPNPSSMRLATYKLPRAGTDVEDTELAVSRAGGNVATNIARWAGQFEGGPPPKETHTTVHDLKVTMVQMEGAYQGAMGAAPSTHEGWAMMAAIVETQGESYFFKVVGPVASVRAARKPFEAMISGITPS
jgi:hypothetical protein